MVTKTAKPELTLQGIEQMADDARRRKEAAQNTLARNPKDGAAVGELRKAIRDLTEAKELRASLADIQKRHDALALEAVSKADVAKREALRGDVDTMMEQVCAPAMQAVADGIRNLDAAVQAVADSRAAVAKKIAELVPASAPNRLRIVQMAINTSRVVASESFVADAIRNARALQNEKLLAPLVVVTAPSVMGRPGGMSHAEYRAQQEAQPQSIAESYAVARDKLAAFLSGAPRPSGEPYVPSSKGNGLTSHGAQKQFAGQMRADTEARKAKDAKRARDADSGEPYEPTPAGDL